MLSCMQKYLNQSIVIPSSYPTRPASPGVGGRLRGGSDNGDNFQIGILGLAFSLYIRSSPHSSH